MRRTTLFLLLIFFGLAGWLRAQSNKPLEFEEDPGLPISQRVLDYPGWFRSDLWTVEAKAEGLPTEASLKKMLQTLLKDRFKLEFHTEVREVPGWALIVDSKGPKLTATSGVPRPGPMGAPPSLRPQLSTASTAGQLTLRAYNQTMSGLAFGLSYSVGPGGPVVDRTGLTGSYDFTLMWSNSNSTAEFLGPSLASALQEQLGLKLVKEPSVKIEFFIIDHAEKPLLQ